MGSTNYYHGKGSSTPTMGTRTPAPRTTGVKKPEILSTNSGITFDIKSGSRVLTKAAEILKKLSDIEVKKDLAKETYKKYEQYQNEINDIREDIEKDISTLPKESQEALRGLVKSIDPIGGNNLDDLLR